MHGERQHFVSRPPRAAGGVAAGAFSCYCGHQSPPLRAPLRRPRPLIHIDPNPLAYAVVILWPLVVWQLYRRLDAGRALIWTVLGAYLILPPLTRINFPVVPDLDKDTLPALAAVVITALMLGKRLQILPESRIGQVLILMFVASPFVTVLTNPDPIPILLEDDIPGMRIYDSVAAVATQALYVLPMFLARRDLATAQAMRDLLKALVAGGLAYSLPMLFEARFSPQLNTWLYGYFQHDFFQTIRFGGYRPVVHLPHGLWTAFFALMALLAAAVFLREGPAEARPKQMAVFLWLAFMLYVCKSFGPASYALMALPVILFLPPRLQVTIAAGIAVVVIVYPLLRGAHLVPVQEIVDFFTRLSPERGWSLQFRIMNEEALLERAAERPWFGWGGYARNFIHDPVTGRATTIADGQWIIQIGMYGWLGYLAEFGLLALPLVLLAREAVARGAVLAPEVAAVAMILALNLLDLLPNGTLVPLTWLMAGAILGHAEALRAARKERAAAIWAAHLDPRPRRTVI